MGAITTLKQNNKPWTLTWKASGRYPIVADRIFATLADAQAYVDDKSATASATGGLVLSVINDTTAKNNGVYYVKSVANTDPKYGAILDKGTLVKVGGAETEVAATYSAAITLSNTLVVGQLIKVSGEETVDGQTYKAGFYIVNAPGSISALDTSTGASDELGAIRGRVEVLEGNRVLNTDFATYKTEVSNALDTKANATDLTTHTTNANIHVTSEDKALWNNAEANAKSYTDEKIASLSTVYDAKGAAATAETNAAAYTDGKVAEVAGVYASEGVNASGLRKEIADRDAQVLSSANTYTDDKVKVVADVVGDSTKGLVQKVNLIQGELDGLNGGAGSITTQIENAISALDLPNTYEAKGEAAKAESAAKAYADGLKTEIEGVISGNIETVNNTISALDARVEAVENYDHEGLASKAAAAAVATILDGAPEKFDTLKEVAEWIESSESAASAADLVTRVGELEVAVGAPAEEGVEASGLYALVDAAEADAVATANAYTDGKDSAMDLRVKALEEADKYVAADVAQSISDAKDAAIAKAAEDAAKMLESYYTKTEVDDLVAGAKTYADGLKTAIDGVIEENERVTSEALTNLDNRVKVIEAQDVYVKDDVDSAIADAKKAGTDAAAALDTYKGEAAQALADNSAADQAYAKTYTDALFTSMKFVENTDIDSIFAAKAE